MRKKSNYMKFSNKIIEKVSSLENLPGIYKFFDVNNQILYIGKSKKLKNRVKSYFRENNHNKKTKIMISKIHRIETFLVNSEMDALLLECNLIKKFQPRYNMLLKDDKTYPWICIGNEKLPKIYQTRKIIKDGSEYFGPYRSTQIIKIFFDYFSELFYSNGWTPHSYISRDLSDKTEKEYLLLISKIRNILKGNIDNLIDKLFEKIEYHSRKLEFEECNNIKEKINLLRNYQSKSTVVSSKIHNVDIFSIVSNDLVSYVNYLKICNGSIIQTYTTEIKKKLDEKDTDILLHSIISIRDKFNSQSKFVYTSINLNKYIFNDFKLIFPLKGEKLTLVKLSKRNVLYTMKDKINKSDQKNKFTDNILDRLQSDLEIDFKPVHIECFDNSNLQGTNPTAACVVFKNGKPSKKDYRHFNIKTVTGPDDYKSMEEIVFRRYNRLLSEKKNLPQLIIIDGGKGQLSSAAKSLEKLNLLNKIKIVGIAKKLEEIFNINDSIPLYLDKRSTSLKLIQHLRNEAHRFGLRHHRNKRSKDSLVSSLDTIEGIGEKTIMKLINKFGSIKRIKEAPKEDVVKIIGFKKYEKLILNLQ